MDASLRRKAAKLTAEAEASQARFLAAQRHHEELLMKLTQMAGESTSPAPASTADFTPNQTSTPTPPARRSFPPQPTSTPPNPSLAAAMKMVHQAGYLTKKVFYLNVGVIFK